MEGIKHLLPIFILYSPPADLLGVVQLWECYRWKNEKGVLREVITKKSEGLDIVPTGGGSDRRGRMSQPTYLVIILGALKLNFLEEIIVF